MINFQKPLVAAVQGAAIGGRRGARTRHTGRAWSATSGHSDRNGATADEARCPGAGLQAAT